MSEVVPLLERQSDWVLVWCQTQDSFLPVVHSLQSSESNAPSQASPVRTVGTEGRMYTRFHYLRPC